MSSQGGRTLEVDGALHQLPADLDGATPLLQALRWYAGRLGVRPGCGHGSCGACTVLIGGQSVRSCITPLDEVAGAITTAEGVAAVIRDAFLELQAGQCAYCINGMLVTLEGLRRAGACDEAALQEALAEHLCRCGVHTRVLAAARHALGIAVATSATGAAAPAAARGGASAAAGGDA